MEEKQIRIKFYGKPNMMIGYYLSKAEEVLNAVTAQSSASDINEALEYFNIIRYFDQQIYLKAWDSQTIQNYKKRIGDLRKIVGKTFGAMERAAIIDTYTLVERQLREDYLDAVVYYKAYEKLYEDDISRLLLDNPSSIGLFVRQRKIVSKYGKAIVDFLRNYSPAAELIINHFFVKQRPNKKETFIPAELTQEDFEIILTNYLEWPEANANYLKIIAGLKKSDSFYVKDKIRLKARRRYQEIISNLFAESGSNPVEYGVDVQFRDQPEISAEKIENTIVKLSYSNEWIDANLDYATLLNNFIYLFGFTDNRMRCQFLSNPDNFGILEFVFGLRAEKDYPTGVDYSIVDMKSRLQMIAYRSILSKHDIEIESVFKWFFEEYLHDEFGVEHYFYVSPTSTASDLEKILVLITQLDAVLKQFRLYVDDKVIDRELYELSTMPYKIVDTPSMLENKYCYSKSDDLKQAQYLLFSDQSGLNYTEKTGSGTVFFADILIHHDVSIADYPEFDHDSIQWLIDKGYIFTDEHNYLRAKITIVNLLYELYHEGSIAYHYCHELQKEAIESLLEHGDIEIESTLFTRREQEYLDYMLNTQTFINGPELRNKYAHGVFPNDVEAHKRDYLELLKIMVLIIIKINEEFCLKYPENKDLP